MPKDPIDLGPSVTGTGSEMVHTVPLSPAAKSPRRALLGQGANVGGQHGRHRAPGSRGSHAVKVHGRASAAGEERRQRLVLGMPDQARRTADVACLGAQTPS